MNIGKLSRDQLIELGQRLLDSKTEEEGNRLYHEFNRQFSHPDAANLFFYPEEHDDEEIVISDDPSVEQVVDIALAHKPILL